MAWPEGASLRFRVHVKATRTLRVVIHEREFAPGWPRYAKELRLMPGDRWQTSRLTAGDFTTDKGERLTGWDGVKMLELDSQGGPGEEPSFGEFRWVRAE